MFSYFSNHTHNIPIGSLTLGDLHNQIVNPDRDPFIDTITMIQQLRGATTEAEEKRIKGLLPAFTPGAMVDTKRAELEKNIIYSGFMQIDIDLHDNPNMTNAEQTRDKLAQVPYIALSAISARGKGVWCLVALQDPEKFKQYSDQVYNYFKSARVTIDKSKSKNPIELRYFAPDPGAILKSKYELMPLIAVSQKVKPRQSIKPTGTTLSDLQRWVTETTGYNFVEGQRHSYLYWLSYALRKNGSSEAEVYNTIYSLMPPDQVLSNCIGGGLTHADNKGVYVPQKGYGVSKS